VEEFKMGSDVEVRLAKIHEHGDVKNGVRLEIA
jgi:hypothetical protein